MMKKIFVNVLTIVQWAVIVIGALVMITAPAPKLPRLFVIVDLVLIVLMAIDLIAMGIHAIRNFKRVTALFAKNQNDFDKMNQHKRDVLATLDKLDNNLSTLEEFIRKTANNSEVKKEGDQ